MAFPPSHAEIAKWDQKVILIQKASDLRVYKHTIRNTLRDMIQRAERATQCQKMAFELSSECGKIQVKIPDLFFITDKIKGQLEQTVVHIPDPEIRAVLLEAIKVGGTDLTIIADVCQCILNVNPQ